MFSNKAFSQFIGWCKPGMLYLVTIATIKALTCFCLFPEPATEISKSSALRVGVDSQAHYELQAGLGLHACDGEAATK